MFFSLDAEFMEGLDEKLKPQANVGSTWGGVVAVVNGWWNICAPMLSIFTVKHCVNVSYALNLIGLRFSFVIFTRRAP